MTEAELILIDFQPNTAKSQVALISSVMMDVFQGRPFQYWAPIFRNILPTFRNIRSSPSVVVIHNVWYTF